MKEFPECGGKFDATVLHYADTVYNTTIIEWTQHRVKSLYKKIAAFLF